MKRKNIQKNITPYIFLFLVILGILYFMENLNNKINTLTFTEFNEALNNNKVKEIYS